MNPFTLPEKLILGTATASLQIEGGDRNNTWYRWCEQGRIKDGTHCIEACDHWNRVEEDVALMAALGTTGYRMSLEWARIEPEEGRFDEEAIGRYRREIALMTGRGIRPMVTLHHFSNPLWLEDAGGWENPRTVDRYLRYVERAVDALGDLVADWVTINEPSGYLVMGYVFGEWPPGKRELAAALRAARNMVRAHAEAYHVIHETRTRVLDGAPAAVGATGDTGFGAAGVVGSGAPPDTDAGSGAGGSEPGGPSPTRVGVAHHLRLFEPARRANPLDHLAAAVFRRLNQDIFVHAMDEGALRRPLGGWPFARVDLPKARGPAGYLSDFFGINYYSRDLVRFAPGSAPLAARREVRPGSQTNDLGWEIYPEGLYRLATRYWKRYHLPIVITENGTADAHDSFRIPFIARHLAEVARAIEDGVDIRGYYHWSLMDNFEWTEGLTPRFGLIEVDYETQERRVRESGRFYREVCRIGGIDRSLIEAYGLADI